MTTIAVRDGVMACDSMVTVSSKHGGTRAFYHWAPKVVRVENELIGGAGDSDGMALWVDWYIEGQYLNDELWQLFSEHDFDIVVLHEDGALESSDQGGVIERIHEPFYAIGSGSKAALGAMHRDATAEEAINIAKLIDPNTGGETHIFRFE